MSDNNQITIVKGYKNKIAKIIGFTGGIILSIGILIAVISAFIVYNETYEMLFAIQSAIKTGVISILIYMFAQGFAEIIELLQDIKNKLH